MCIYVCMQIPIQWVELIKNMGILIKPSSLAAVLQRSSRQPIRLLRLLLMELFTEDEFCTSSMRGKKGIHPGLDQNTINAILCKFNTKNMLHYQFSYVYMQTCMYSYISTKDRNN